MIAFYLFNSEPYEANNGFTDCVKYSNDLSELLEYEGEVDNIWAVDLETGEPLLIAEWRNYMLWRESKRISGWYHPHTDTPFTIVSWLKFSQPLDV